MSRPTISTFQLFGLFPDEHAARVYHHASEKHLACYVDEFTFRLNDGDVKRHTLERLASLAMASFESRLTYKELTA